MGQGHRKIIAAGFTQHTSKELSGQLEQPELPFAGKVVEFVLVECERESESVTIKVGDKVKLLDLRDNIYVFSGTRKIGFVAPHHLDLVRNSYDLSTRRDRSIAGVIQEVSDLTCGFFVILNNEHH